VARALADFRDPRIVEKVLAMTVSDEVRTQDAARLMGAVLGNTDNQKVAWAWIKANWPAVEKKTTMSSGGAIVGATGSFCSAEMRDDAQSFFTQHKLASTERGVKQVYEAADSCIKKRPRLQGELAQWLKQH
jgi:aminopeptidase N